jgi:hypothetical protein
MGVRVRLRLSDVDRERYQCKEWLEFDFDEIEAWDVALIQRGFVRDGIRVAFDNPNLWSRALADQVIKDDNGNPVMDPVLDSVGAPVLDENGEPLRVPQRKPDMGAVLILVWLALRYNGTDVPMDQVRVRLSGMHWDLVTGDEPEDEPVPGESEGKDDDDSPSSSGTDPTSPS